MFFLDLFPKLIYHLITSVVQFYHGMTMILITVIAFLAKKFILYAIWLIISISINIVWLMKYEKENRLILPISQLTFSNVLVMVTFVDLEWKLSSSTEWVARELMCKTIMWLQTTSLITSAAFTLQSLNLFLYPENNRRKVMKIVLRIWFACSLLALAKVSF